MIAGHGEIAGLVPDCAEQTATARRPVKSDAMSAESRLRATVARPLSGSTLWADLAQVVRNIVARHRERQLIIALSRRNSRLLDDMGFDPEAIRKAVENSWDEYRPELMSREPWARRGRD